MSKQKLISGQMTIENPPQNDRSQRERTLLVSSGFAPGPGSRPRAWARSRPGLGPGVRPSYFFFGVMRWGGGIDFFPRRRGFGAGAGSRSGLPTGSVPVPAEKSPCNYPPMTPLHYYMQLTENTSLLRGSCFVLFHTSVHGTWDRCKKKKKRNFSNPR